MENLRFTIYFLKPITNLPIKKNPNMNSLQADNQIINKNTEMILNAKLKIRINNFTLYVIISMSKSMPLLKYPVNGLF